MLTNLLFSKALGSKDRKDDNRFGIEFVECVKIVRFKIGNYVTQDDIWHPIYVKLKKKNVQFMEI
jgi:hypothetical protein